MSLPVLSPNQMQFLIDRVARVLYLDFGPAEASQVRAPWREGRWQDAADSAVKEVINWWPESPGGPIFPPDPEGPKEDV